MATNQMIVGVVVVVVEMLQLFGAYNMQRRMNISENSVAVYKFGLNSLNKNSPYRLFNLLKLFSFDFI